MLATTCGGYVSMRVVSSAAIGRLLQLRFGPAARGKELLDAPDGPVTFEYEQHSGKQAGGGSPRGKRAGFGGSRRDQQGSTDRLGKGRLASIVRSVKYIQASAEMEACGLNRAEVFDLERLQAHLT